MNTALELRVTRQVLIGLKPVLAWFTVIILAVFAIVGTALIVTSDTANTAAEIAGAGALRYFPMALGIMFTPVMLPMYVSQGVTRRQFARASAVVTFILAALMALLMCVGLAVERLAFEAAGQTYRLGLPHLFDTWNDFGLIVTEYVVLTAATIAGGWLIGTTYYSLHWFAATLLIPACLVPTVTAEMLLQTSWFGAGLEEAGWARPPLALAIPSSLVAIAVAIAAAHLLTRNVTIKLGS